MFGDHVQDSSMVMREDDEDEEQPEGDRWYDQEVGGHDLARVISEEGPPRCDGGRRCRRMYLATVD
jgi:hypothetical protein